MHMDTGLGYLNEGRNKFHVTLDLEKPEGQEVLRKLAKRADVLVETFLPGTMDEWGIGYRQLSVGKSRAHLLRALHLRPVRSQGGLRQGRRGRGQPGVFRNHRGDRGASRRSRPIRSLRKSPPSRATGWAGMPEAPGRPWPSWRRCITGTDCGKGQFIDVSSAEAFGRCINYGLTYYQGFQDTIPRVGNYDVGVFPYTYFKCKDGYAFLSGFSDINWKALCTILNRPDLRGQYPTIFDRLNLDNMKVMYKEIEKWTLTHTYDEIYDAVMDYNKNVGEGIVVPGRISAPMETMKAENWWVRMAFEKIEDPHLQRNGHRQPGVEDDRVAAAGQMGVPPGGRRQ